MRLSPCSISLRGSPVTAARPRWSFTTFPFQSTRAIAIAERTPRSSPQFTRNHGYCNRVQAREAGGVPRANACHRPMTAKTLGMACPFTLAPARTVFIDMPPAVDYLQQSVRKARPLAGLSAMSRSASRLSSADFRLIAVAEDSNSPTPMPTAECALSRSSS
jgi:hypothetical protein